MFCLIFYCVCSLGVWFAEFAVSRLFLRVNKTNLLMFCCFHWRTVAAFTLTRSTRFKASVFILFTSTTEPLIIRRHGLWCSFWRHWCVVLDKMATASVILASQMATVSVIVAWHMGTASVIVHVIDSLWMLACVMSLAVLLIGRLLVVVVHVADSMWMIACFACLNVCRLWKHWCVMLDNMATVSVIVGWQMATVRVVCCLMFVVYAHHMIHGWCDSILICPKRPWSHHDSMLPRCMPY